MVKNPPANAEDVKRSLGQEEPQKRTQQLTPVLLPGESHGQRSPAGSSPPGRKDSDRTETTSHPHTHTHTHTKQILKNRENKA